MNTKNKSKHFISNYQAMRSVRKQMPRPTESHGHSKYKRNKDWKRADFD